MPPLLLLGLLATAPPVQAAPEPPRPAQRDPDAVARARHVPGEGLEFTTADGRFSLQLRARLQVRYDFVAPSVPDRPTTGTLQIRRARLQLKGNAFGRHNRYYIQFGFSPADQTNGLIAGTGSIRRNPIRDARLEFDHLRDFTLFVGQMKIPFSRQRVISSGNQSMVDRSIANAEFQLDRDIGVQALSRDVGGIGWLTYNAGVFMGEGRNAFEPSDFGLLYVARVEALPLGPFDDYSEGDLARSKRPGLSLGAAYAFHDRAIGDRGVHGEIPADGGTTDLHNVTADVFFKWCGAAFHGAFHWRKAARRNPGDALDEEMQPISTARPRDGLGGLAQLSWILPQIPLEFAGRYSFVRRIGGDTSAIQWHDELGPGVSYYFAGHNLKLQLDYFRVWGEDTGAGVSQAIRRGTDRVRLQVQLAF